MKNIFKKITVLTAVTTIVAGMFIMPVSADELEGLTFNPSYISESGIELYDFQPPSTTNVWNLATKGAYHIEGSGNTNATLYTSYLFTGVSTLSITISNTSSSETTVNVLKQGGWFAVSSFTVPAGGQVSRLVNVNSSNKYYLSFSCPCNVSGYIA